MLKPCPYRRSIGSYLECSITEDNGKNTTSYTSKDICEQCLIPTIIQQVNCKNIKLGKFHRGIVINTFNSLPGTQISEDGWQANCEAVGFNASDDYQTHCSHECPAFQPRHRDLSSEEPISIVCFDAAKATDQKLRQAILIVLYQYHTRHPERYQDFDVTPEFLAKSLNISVLDILRVVAPMEDEKEVVTKRCLGDAWFRYVKITSQGIKMIDEKPLFERLDTAEIRHIGHFINMHNSQVGNLNIGDNHQHEGDIVSELSQKFSSYNLPNSQWAGGIVDAETVQSHQIGGDIYNTNNREEPA